MLKVSELEGAELDAAVSKADGCADGVVLPYSTDWEWGGPIIHREKIAILGSLYDDTWEAHVRGFSSYNGIESKPEHAYTYDAPTPLIAAMRAFVASKQ